MKIFDELIEELKAIKTPKIMGLLQQTAMIVCVVLIFVGHFESIDYIYKYIKSIGFIKNLLSF